MEKLSLYTIKIDLYLYHTINPSMNICIVYFLKIVYYITILFTIIVSNEQHFMYYFLYIYTTKFSPTPPIKKTG